MTKVYDTDKCFCRVHSINEKETLIEFFFPDGELVQKANTVLVNILKRLNLHEQGAEFYNISTETEDSLIVKIEPYIEESSDESELHKKYMKMSDALGPNTGPSSEENFYDDDEEEFNIVEFICKNPLTYNWYL